MALRVTHATRAALKLEESTSGWSRSQLVVQHVRVVNPELDHQRTDVPAFEQLMLISGYSARRRLIFRFLCLI